MIEAVNATSIDVHYGVSEWALSGLTEEASSTVKAGRVKEAVVSIEGRLLEMKSLDYEGLREKAGKPSGALAIIMANRFWVREDTIDGERKETDLDKLRPLVQLGGISYGRVRETFELPKPSLKTELEDNSSGLRECLEKSRHGDSV